MQTKEGTYLSSHASTFGMKRSFAFSSPISFNIELFTFLKPCVSYLLEALCYSSFGDGVSEK